VVSQVWGQEVAIYQGILQISDSRDYGCSEF